MSFAFSDVIFCPTGTGVSNAVSALGKIICANPGPAPTGVQYNGYTQRNPIEYLIPRYSGLMHPSQLYGRNVV